MAGFKGQRNTDAYTLMIELEGAAAVCDGLSLMPDSERLSDNEMSVALWGLSTWIRRISEDLERLDERDLLENGPDNKRVAGKGGQR